MNNLYYGHGKVTIEGNANFILIIYRGAVNIRDISHKDYFISATKNTIMISSFRKTDAVLSELFTYIGELRIISATSNGAGMANVPTTVHRVMDYSELLNSTSETMTTKSEDLNATYIYGRIVNKTKLFKKIIPDLHTNQEDSLNLLLNGEDYSGNYHKHIETGMIMTGARHTKGSSVLTIKSLRDR